MSMQLTVFNNLTRAREVFKPLDPQNVKFYSCGPTTYDFLHVGNARALVVSDLIFRVLKFAGFGVTFVRNFTDVDDKIIAASSKLGIDASLHAEKYVQECLVDMSSLNMLPATFSPKVTETMPEIIAMIKTLIEKNFAYVVDGEVLYQVEKKADYGKLSKKDLSGLELGHRVEVEVHKKHPADFVLWKPAKNSDPQQVAPSWDSPWGKGRPGWHIECSAMAKKFLGDQLDLHHGGVDLMFPHHENEIAQSEAANGCSFCQSWVHNAFLNFGNEKMSKSLGNVVTIRAFVEKYSGLVLRHLLLSVQYRASLDWTQENIDRAIQESLRIHEFLLEFNEKKQQQQKNEQVVGQSNVVNIEKIYNKMVADLLQDFNSAAALAQFFIFIRTARGAWEKSLPNSAWFAAGEKIIQLLRDTLGLVSENLEATIQFYQKLKREQAQEGAGSVDASVIERKLAERTLAKSRKDFKTSDAIRDELLKMGIKIKDNPDGTSSWE